MIEWLKNWLDGRRRARERAQFARGHEWGKYALQAGSYSPESLRAFTEGQFNNNSYERAFDAGVAAACDAAELKQ